MEEALSFDNILGEQEIETLFTAPEEEVEDNNKDSEFTEEEVESKESNNKQKNNTTEVVNPDELFEDTTPESVGSGKNNEGTEEDTVHNDNADGTSPNNFYSSIAKACAVDGIFPNLDEETIKKAIDAESFSNLIDAEINARFDERQQRIAKALDNGIEPNEIKKYENTLNYISTITDASLSEESEKGEQLRYNLIYQDFLNKGMKPEAAKKFTDRSIEAGTDIDDAKEALTNNKEFFATKYNTLLQEAQMAADEEKAERAKQAQKLQNSLMNDKQLMGDIEINKDMRKKAFEAISRPIYKDPETGTYLTAIQKYETENRADFLKYTGLIYAMTNGFKDFESFTKGKVKKEIKKGLRELEDTLTNTRKLGNGSLRMVTNQNEDPNSYFSKGIKLDL